MNKKILHVGSAFLIVGFIIGAIFINEKNYVKIKQMTAHVIKHPEMLPKKEIAKYTSPGYNNLRADIYWLEAIQYIGENAISSEYKKYLYKMLDLITELNPYFEKPYIIGMLLLPNYNERYEDLHTDQIQELNQQAEKIGLKGIKNFCDETKINAIQKENNLQKIWFDAQYQNPCKTYEIPYNLGFVYYYYLKKPEVSAQYYKIAAAHSNSVEGAKVMSAIMTGKGGNREKSLMMFLTLADNLKQNDESSQKCSNFSKELQKVSYALFHQNAQLDGKSLAYVEKLRQENFPYDEKNSQEKIIQSENCFNYINKAVRELNLHYIETANKKYLQQTGKNAQTPEELFEKKFIDYIPVDFQQNKDMGIIYKYNPETGGFDYDMESKR